VKSSVQPRDWQQRFAGFRVNCENVPRLPGWAVRRVLNREVNSPHLFVWRSRRDYDVCESLIVVWTGEDEWVEVDRWNGSAQRIRTAFVKIPNGAEALLLFCVHCGALRRHLYGWAVTGGAEIMRSLWLCRFCAGLRYSSEGRCIPRAFRSFDSGFERITPWDPIISLHNASRS